LFGGNLSNYFLGDTDARGTTLSEQRALFASGTALPMPIYTCVRKDVESESANDQWMPDDASAACLACGAKWASFGLFAPSGRSRHHCRSCGRLVCGACSTHRAVVGAAAARSSDSAPAVAAAAESEVAKERMRVCDDCFREKRFETSNTKRAKNWCVSLLRPQGMPAFSGCKVCALTRVFVCRFFFGC
jgi:hypothetical protein